MLKSKRLFVVVALVLIVALGTSLSFADAKSEWMFPVKEYKDILSDFSVEHPGIDILVTEETEVMATSKGVVSAFDFDGDICPSPPKDLCPGCPIPWPPKRLVIEHENRIKTIYENIDNINVKLGETVDIGQVIGTVYKPEEFDVSYLHVSFVFDSKEGPNYLHPKEFVEY